MEVKRATAVGHLVELGAAASERLRLRETDIGWPLEELWAAGELLEERQQLEAGTVVLVLDLPPDELPWLATHPAAEWVGSELRFGRRPFFWSYRPALWPVWNHRHRRLVRFWTAHGGTDAAVIDALREPRLRALPVVEPVAAELVDQLTVELAASHRHLRTVLNSYWDPGWRRLHTSAEDQLWRAAQATVEITDALAEWEH